MTPEFLGRALKKAEFPFWVTLRHHCCCRCQIVIVAIFVDSSPLGSHQLHVPSVKKYYIHVCSPHDCLKEQGARIMFSFVRFLRKADCEVGSPDTGKELLTVACRNGCKCDADKSCSLLLTTHSISTGFTCEFSSWCGYSFLLSTGVKYCFQPMFHKWGAIICLPRSVKFTW